MRGLEKALNVNPCEEGDPVIRCYFKTELTANLLTLTNASIEVHIGPVWVPCQLIISPLLT